ncbi:unnamed protein product, partial [Didymodactylos carnosus]
MTVATNTVDLNAQFEWKTLIDSFSTSTDLDINAKYLSTLNELIDSILKWEELLIRSDPLYDKFFLAFVILATKYITSALQNIDHSIYFDVINVSKILLKYLLHHALPKSNEKNRLCVIHGIQTLCYAQSDISSQDYKECLELIKTVDCPQINKDDRHNREKNGNTKCRENQMAGSLCNIILCDFSTEDAMTKLSQAYSSSSSTGGGQGTGRMTFSKYLSQLMINYFKQLHGDQLVCDILFNLPILNKQYQISMSAILTNNELVTINDITVFRESLPLIYSDLDFVRKCLNLPIFEPLTEQRLNSFISLTLNSLFISLIYISLDLTTLPPSTVDCDQFLHDIAGISMKIGEMIKMSLRFVNSKEIYLNYHLLITLLLTKGIKQILNNGKEISQSAPLNSLLSHLICVLMLSTKEICNDVRNETVATATTTWLSSISSVLQPADRYSYLKQNQTFKLFLTVLSRLVYRSIHMNTSVVSTTQTTVVTPSIPQAPPLPTSFKQPSPTNDPDIGIVSSSDNEDTEEGDQLFISCLFDETNGVRSRTGPLTSPLPQNPNSNRSKSNRKRRLMSKCLETDSCQNSEDTPEEDADEILSFLETNYLAMDLTTSTVLYNDISETMNSKQELDNLAKIIKHGLSSPLLTRFMNSLIQQNILTRDNENYLLSCLNISPISTSNIQHWPLNIHPRTLNILLKIILQRILDEDKQQLSKQPVHLEMVYIWKQFLKSLKDVEENEKHNDTVNLEHLQVLLVFFHQLPIMIRKTLLLKIANDIITTKPKYVILYSRLLIIFEYMIHHFYEPQPQLIQNIQKRIHAALKTSQDTNVDTQQADDSELDKQYRSKYPQSTSPSYYRLTRCNDASKSTDQEADSTSKTIRIDGLAMNLLLSNPDQLDYSQLYSHLIKQLDFTLLPSENEKDVYSLRYFYDILWCLLSCLPPSTTYMKHLLSNDDWMLDSALVLHTLRIMPKLNGNEPYLTWLNDMIQKQTPDETNTSLVKQVQEKLNEPSFLIKLSSITQEPSLFNAFVFKSILCCLESSKSAPIPIDQLASTINFYIDELKTSLKNELSAQYDSLTLSHFFDHLYSILTEQPPTQIKTPTAILPNIPKPISKLIDDRTKSTIPSSLTTTVDLNQMYKHYVGYLLNDTNEDKGNKNYMMIKQILLTLCSKEYDDQQLYIRISLDYTLSFLNVKVPKTEVQQQDIYNYIYKNIFSVLFDTQLPNDIINEQFFHDLLHYLEEQQPSQTFFTCLQQTQHDLYDLLYLTSKQNLASQFFTKMLMFLNKLFSFSTLGSSSELKPLIKSLNRIADLNNEQLSQWLSRLVLPPTVHSTITATYTPEECKDVLETFTKHLVKKDSDGKNIIGEEVSLSVLSTLIQLANELLGPSKFAIGFPQSIQLLIILAGHGTGSGHTYLFQAAAIWLEFCADALDNSNNKDSKATTTSTDETNVDNSGGSLTSSPFLSSLLSSTDCATTIATTTDDPDSMSIFHSNILEASVYLLSYINDVLSSLKLLTTPSEAVTTTSDDQPSLKPVEHLEADEDSDDEEEFDSENNDESNYVEQTQNIGDAFDPNKLCTYTITKREYMNQHWYHCHTCRMIDRVGICQICANVCHKDHDISYAKFGSFFCDCGAKDDGSCQALVKRPMFTQTTTKTKTKTTISTKNKNKTKIKNHKQKQSKHNKRHQLLSRQIQQSRQEFYTCIQTKHVPLNALRLLRILKPYIENEYSQVYDQQNKFNMTQEFLKYSWIKDEHLDNTPQLLSVTLCSQEGAFEHVKLSFAGEHGQQIKQLLSTNSIRRQGMCIMSNGEQKQHLVVSQEKGKQSMITILQLSTLLKQAVAASNPSTSAPSSTAAAPSDSSTASKKKLTLTKLSTINIPFTIVTMQPNLINNDYLCVTGLKDCHIYNINHLGQIKEPTIVLQPGLDSSGNYIIKTQWLLDKNQTQLALLTADFIKIYDLSIDIVSPIYYFLLPAGKVRDCTFYYKKNDCECYILIMASNGYIYYEQLCETSSAKNGSFYVTNTLDLKHDTIQETNGNGIILGGGVSVYYSSVLKILLWSYLHGKNFYGIIDEQNIERMLMIRSIDIKMSNGTTPTKSTYHTLCQWSEIQRHPGLICSMTQMTSNPVVLMITPEKVHAHEVKLPSKTTKTQDLAALRHSTKALDSTIDDKTTFILLAEDGSLKILLADLDKTDYWLNKKYRKKKQYPTLKHDQNEGEEEEQHEEEDDEGNETITPTNRKQQQQITSVRPFDNVAATGTPRFPVDFFESCTLLTEYEFGGRDLLDVYNVAQLKLRLSSPGMFVANVRTGGFTLDVINKDPDNTVFCGVRIHVGSYLIDKCPQYFELFGRTVQVNYSQGPRWYDICLTRQESLQADKKFSIIVGQSTDTNHVTIIDDVKVYGKTKDQFNWPDDVDNSLLTSSSSPTTAGTTTTTQALSTLSNSDREIATLSLMDKLIMYSMNVLTGSLTLNQLDETDRVRINQDIVYITSKFFQLSIPLSIQKCCRQLLCEYYSPNQDLYNNNLDHLQLDIISTCLSSENFLDSFDIETYESLLITLSSIARKRPQSIIRYLNIVDQSEAAKNKDAISKSSSITIFIPRLVNIFIHLLNNRPSSSLLESIDNPSIDLSSIEVTLRLLVDLYHSLAIYEPTVCMNLVVDAYLKLLTYNDYHINFMMKNSLNRCMQPKIRRLISKLSTASDTSQRGIGKESRQDKDNDNSQSGLFQPMQLSANIYNDLRASNLFTSAAQTQPPSSLPQQPQRQSSTATDRLRQPWSELAAFSSAVQAATITTTGETNTTSTAPTTTTTPPMNLSPFGGEFFSQMFQQSGLEMPSANINSGSGSLASAGTVPQFDGAGNQDEDEQENAILQFALAMSLQDNSTAGSTGTASANNGVESQATGNTSHIAHGSASTNQHAVEYGDDDPDDEIDEDEDEMDENYNLANAGHEESHNPDEQDPDMHHMMMMMAAAAASALQEEASVTDNALEQPPRQGQQTHQDYSETNSMYDGEADDQNGNASETSSVNGDGPIEVPATMNMSIIATPNTPLTAVTPATTQNTNDLYSPNTTVHSGDGGRGSGRRHENYLNGIDHNLYEQRLYSMKRLIVEKLLENIEPELMMENSGINSIAYLQLLLTLTIEFASQNKDKDFVEYIIKTLLKQMIFIKNIKEIDLEDLTDDEDIIKRSPKKEIQLMLLRLFTVYVSFMLKVQPNEREQYRHLSVTTANYLNENGVADYCLYVLKAVYRYLMKQPINESTTAEQALTQQPQQPQQSAANLAAPALLKPLLKHTLPDLSPFFYKPYTKHHASDVFESYPELLAEIATRLPYQMKKVFDSIESGGRSFDLSSSWQTCLCEYLVLPQALFLKRQIRKLLLYICGTREKYRKLRDIHVLSTNLIEIKTIYQQNFLVGDLQQRKTATSLSQISYTTLVTLVDRLKSCQDISVQRRLNWQKFCKRDSSILQFLFELCLLVDDSIVPFVLQCVVNAVSSSSSSSTSTSSTSQTSFGRSLRSSKSTRPPESTSMPLTSSQTDAIEDLSSYSIAAQIHKHVSPDVLKLFLKQFLLDNNQQQIRWLTHTFFYNLYINSNLQFQEQLYELLMELWPIIPHYGSKAFQYIDLLGYLVVKMCKTDADTTNDKISKFLSMLETLLKDENLLLSNHPNSSIYRRLSTIIDLDQGGYYLENEPCLVCNNPDIQYQSIKLQSIKLDQRYTTQSHIIKLIQCYSIQKLHIKLSEIKRQKMVRTIRFYYNNRNVQSIVDLKNSVNCKWMLAKTIKLNPAQNDCKIDFTLPIIACNLQIEYVDFYESITPATQPTDATTLQCPRCNSAVSTTPGICPNCGENVFQCHKCRSINYDERDPFLCNSCGFCKYAKFEFNFSAKHQNYVDPIESDDDRTKTLANISQLLDKTDKIYRQLINQKPLLEYLLTKLNDDSTMVTTGGTVDEQQPPTATAQNNATSAAGGGINKIVQQIAPKYNIECRQTYDELGKYIQKIICSRKELYDYDKRHKTTTITIERDQPNLLTTPVNNCYGCTLSTISHCILLLRSLCSTSSIIKKRLTTNMSLINELLLNNIRYSNQQIRSDVRLLLSHLTRDNPTLTDYITEYIYDKIDRSLDQSPQSLQYLVNSELLVLYTFIQRFNDDDTCWEKKFRCVLKIFLKSVTIKNPNVLETITLPSLRMILHLSRPYGTSITQAISTSTKKILPLSSTDERQITAPANIDVESFLNKQFSYNDWITSLNRQQQQSDSLTTFSLSSLDTPDSWLKKLLFCPQSPTIRYLTCKLIQSLCWNEKHKLTIIYILINYLHMISDLSQYGEYSNEYLQLIKDLIENDTKLKMKLCEEPNNILKRLAQLISNELVIIQKYEQASFHSSLTFGYSIKCLSELLNLFLQQQDIRQKYKSILIGVVLNSYLSLKKLIIQRTKLIDEAQTKMLELLEKITTGNEDETKQFMIVCIDTIDKFDLDDMMTPQFIFERLCNLIYPEETIQGNKEFFLILEKDPNQEDFLQ